MQIPEAHKHVFITGWLLAATALLGTGMMAAVNWHSKPYIELNERTTLLRSLNAVVASDSYDNDLLNDMMVMGGGKYLGHDSQVVIYRARSDNKPVSAALKVIAPNGYSGEIDILVGISYVGDITGVRVVRHRETPGLGDGIELRHSNWIKSFDGKSINNPGSSQWKVKRDGGYFDQFTGATITPRAVVNTIHNTLLFFDNHKEEVFQIDSAYKRVEQ